MTSERKAIRHAVKAALMNSTDAADKVFASRARKLFENDISALGFAILIYADDENISIFNESPREYRRVLSLKIEVAAQGGDDLDDKLDDFSKVIEALMSKAENQTLGGLVGDVVLTRAQTNIVEEGDKASGGCLMTYEATYYTLDVAECSGLDAFETAGIDYKVVPSVGEPPAAGDLISLEQ